MEPARKTYGFYVDVFSYCNLRCPSCIVGNKYGDVTTWPNGVMQPELLARILDKALAECDVSWVGLYNWTEPLLHPRLPEMIRTVKSRNVPITISSNLNVLRNPELIFQENPDHFRVSLSGFTQPIYEIGHRAGNIETVKNNLKYLAEAKKAVSNSTTQVQIFYHRYNYNTHEIAPMKALADSLGFRFDTILAQVFPVEKIIEISEGRISADDHQLLSRLLLPLDKALVVTSQTKKASCNLLEEMFTLDVQGNVMLCCGSSMERSNVVGNFLDFSIAELEQRKRAMKLCNSCLNLGIPDYFAGHPEFENLIESATNSV